MSAVVVTAVFTPEPGKEQELATALSESLPAIHEEPGCILYALHTAPDGRIVMLEKWASREDLAAHDTSPGVQALRAAIDGLVAGPVAVEFLTPLPAGTPEQGAL
jgi:quinol monooxygenase YgiN